MIIRDGITKRWNNGEENEEKKKKETRMCMGEKISQCFVIERLKTMRPKKKKTESFRKIIHRLDESTPFLSYFYLFILLS